MTYTVIGYYTANGETEQEYIATNDKNEAINCYRQIEGHEDVEIRLMDGERLVTSKTTPKDLSNYYA